MAAEAGRGGSRIAEAEAGGDLLAAPPGQDGIGAGMRAAGGGGFLPGGDLVLPHHGAIALGPAMTGRSGAAGDTFEGRIADCARSRIERGEPDHRQHAHGARPADQACDALRQHSPHLTPPRCFAADPRCPLQSLVGHSLGADSCTSTGPCPCSKLAPAMQQAIIALAKVSLQRRRSPRRCWRAFRAGPNSRARSAPRPAHRARCNPRPATRS